AWPVPCPGLMECVEQGHLDDDHVRGLLKTILSPWLDQPIKAVVLGCTHYPFLRKAIAPFFPADVPLPGASVFVAIGDNAVRRAIYARLRGHDFPSLIDPSAQVSPTTEFRHGTYIAVEAVVSVGTDIGKFVIINARAGVGHDSKVGDFANICPGVSLSGHTTIGDSVFMGTNSCTAPGVTVGAGAVVACGVPVYANVPEGATLSPFGVLKAGQ
ncbi:MAG: hypothetical protein IJ983_02555, partial [Kiritimatiellae bacterium]|nr:hypothetical protein [Kiritimatiellia bacterium]